jgi:hypothetical protein
MFTQSARVVHLSQRQLRGTGSVFFRRLLTPTHFDEFLWFSCEDEAVYQLGYEGDLTEEYLEIKNSEFRHPSVKELNGKETSRTSTSIANALISLVALDE